MIHISPEVCHQWLNHHHPDKDYQLYDGESFFQYLLQVPIGTVDKVTEEHHEDWMLDI